MSEWYCSHEFTNKKIMVKRKLYKTICVLVAKKVRLFGCSGAAKALYCINI